MIGIMQGRLTKPVGGLIQCFPRHTWKDEFPNAEKADIGCIEWIFDTNYLDKNPILSAEGIVEMKQLSDKYGVEVHSLCADYFMDYPLIPNRGSGLDDNIACFNWLIGRCSIVGIKRITLPFVDNSEIKTDDEIMGVIKILRKLLKEAEKRNVEIHLETSLAPIDFWSLLRDLPSLKVNYDTGNSASLGYDPREEFSAYGERVGSIHIKDRILGGTTVPLGQGNVSFDVLDECLNIAGYSGDFILQVARGVEGEEIQDAIRNKQIVQFRLGKANV